MGLPDEPHKVKLFVGLLSGDQAVINKTVDALRRAFGRIDLVSPVIDFTYSSYYRDEMGDGLKRVFVSFDRLIPLKNIYKIKLKTNALEKKYSLSGKRSINIDPGYIDHAKVVLFSTKDYTHRIYLDKGVHAEVTLFYKDKKFNPWPWTYPDYKTDEYLKFFSAIRDIYKKTVTA